MRLVPLSDSVSVSEQIYAVEVAAIAAAGFKVLVNNRPDGEAHNQPTSIEIGSAAEQAGLAYYHLPVTAQNFPGPDFELMASLLNDVDSPVLAFCRSGTRCANLWLASRSEEQRESSIAVARQLGYDLSMAAHC